MARITTRLTELEKRIQPDKEFVTVFKNGEDYWRTTGDDYRQTIGGPGCQPLTLAQIGELEKTYQVIMVEYVEWKRANDTLAEALTEITAQEKTNG